MIDQLYKPHTNGSNWQSCNWDLFNCGCCMVLQQEFGVTLIYCFECIVCFFDLFSWGSWVFCKPTPTALCGSCFGSCVYCLNRLAGFTALAAALSLANGAHQAGLPEIGDILLTVEVAITGFLVFNFPFGIIFSVTRDPMLLATFLYRCLCQFCGTRQMWRRLQCYWYSFGQSQTRCWR